MVFGPSIVFTQKVVVDKKFNRDSTNLCQSIAGIDASRIYPFSMFQAMPTGLYTRWELKSDSSNFQPRQNKTRSLETWSCHTFSAADHIVKWKVSATGTQKKYNAYSVDGFPGRCNTVFEAMGCSYHYCPFQETRPSLSEEEFQRGTKKRKLEELQRQYIQE